MARKKKQETTTVINYPIEISARGFVQMARSFPQESIPEIVAALDAMCEDWDITEQIINHFLHLKRVGEKELDAGDFDFKPKQIKTELHYVF